MPNIPFLPPSVPYTRDPSNLPVRGFHPVSECLLGGPTIPRSYEHIRPVPSMDKVDNHQFTSLRRGDLSLRYTYELWREYNLGGEIVMLPIIVHVFRRDFHLLWSEIKNYFRTGAIPERYGPRITADGVVHEPMNEDNFRRLVRRFYMITTPLSTEWILERSTGWPVQSRHSDFEYTFYRHILFTYGRNTVLSWTPAELAAIVNEEHHTWHLDAILRAQMALLDVEYNY